MNAEPGVPLTPLSGRVGQVLPGEGAVVTHRPDLPRARVLVENTSQWPVVITSHFHFFEANRLLRFDRGAAFGMHLDVLAGGSERFEVGAVREVDLDQLFTGGEEGDDASVDIPDLASIELDFDEDRPDTAT